MAYGERRTDKNSGRHYADFDECIDNAKNEGQVQVKTMPKDEMDGIVGMDDIDRIRRKKLGHQTKL